MCLQIERPLTATNQWSAKDRSDQMIVGQLSDEHWRNGPWVSEHGQEPREFILFGFYPRAVRSRC